MVLEEAGPQPGRDVVALGVEQGAGLLPGGVGSRAEDDVEHRADGGRQVARVAWIVDEDAVDWERERVTGGRNFERQAVVAGEHPGRADGQRVERLGLARQLAGAGGEADVEAPEGDPDRPGRRARRRGWRCRPCRSLAA